jgi:hypothetical protein
MQDQRGLYYYPNPGNRRVRVYVRERQGEVEFRLYSEEDPHLWGAHGWVPHGAILQAASIYSGARFDPRTVYDLRLARELLAEQKPLPGPA